MSHKVIPAQVKGMIAAQLAEQGMELYEMELSKGSQGRILRVFIDVPGGVDTDACVRATHAIKDFVDSPEGIDYDFLEVSSPGIDRMLRHDMDLARHQGARVMIKTSQPYEGRKKFIGILSAFDEEAVTIESEDQPVRILRAIITTIRLHPEF